MSATRQLPCNIRNYRNFVIVEFFIRHFHTLFSIKNLKSLSTEVPASKK